MGFNTRTVVEVLEWDFTSQADATDADKGITPSPTPEAIDLFKARYWGLMEELNKAAVNTDVHEGEDPVTTAKRLLDDAKRPLDERVRELHERTAEPDKGAAMVRDEVTRILADVCAGSPTEAQIRLLGGRELQAFAAYMNEQLNAPKFNFAAKP
jgi:hypothetical protein